MQGGCVCPGGNTVSIPWFSILFIVCNSQGTAFLEIILTVNLYV